MSTSTVTRAPKGRRGRESASDMVRSLGLVLLVVIAAWWLAQPNDEDEQEIRVVDPGPSIAQLARQSPGVPVPTAVPVGWSPTVDAGTPDGLRLGYVTAGREYVEYAVSVADAAGFLADTTGRGSEVGTFDVDGVTWRQFVNGDDVTTLVRTAGSATVTVGGVRETATLDEISDLAAVVAP